MIEGDVEAALERLREAAGDHVRNESGMMADIATLVGNWPIIERHIEAQAQEIERLRGLLREHGACRMCSGRGDRAMCMCDGQTCRANCHSNERPCYYCKGTGLQEWAATALAGEAKP